jgi:hypothetical protein
LVGNYKDFKLLRIITSLAQSAARLADLFGLLCMAIITLVILAILFSAVMVICFCLTNVIHGVLQSKCNFATRFHNLVSVQEYKQKSPDETGPCNYEQSKKEIYSKRK